MRIRILPISDFFVGGQLHKVDFRLSLVDSAGAHHLIDHPPLLIWRYGGPSGVEIERFGH
jgi:hypothetical protein